MSLAAVGAVAAALATGPAPPPEPTPEAPIVVGSTPISRGVLRHWTDVVARSSGEHEHRLRYRRQAAALLISFRWIFGEAGERGIVVTRAQVGRAFRRQRDETFPRRSDFRKFLRDSGQTLHDVRLRVRLDILASRIRDQVTAAGRDAAEQQELLDAFVVEFRREWRERTACRPPWVVEECRATAGRSPAGR